MALVIKEIKKDNVVEIENFTSLIEEAEDIVKPFKNIVVDSNNIENCKEFKTKLNGIIKVINDSRISSQKLFMKPFDYGKSQYDAIIKVFQETADNIKSQLDQVEEEYRKSKREKIEILFETIFNTCLIPLEKIYNSKWDNHTYRLDTIEKELKELKEKIDTEIDTIKSITTGEDLYNLLAEYYDTLDMAQAINKVKTRKETIAIIKKEMEGK